MEFSRKTRDKNKLIKVSLASYLVVWLTLGSEVLSSWNSRNLNYSRIGGVKIGERDRGSGVKIGSIDRTYKTNLTGRVGAGIKLGGKGNFKSKEVLISKEGAFAGGRDPVEKSETKVFKLRLLLPYKSFGFREYNKAATSALNSLKRGSSRKLDLFRQYDIETQIETLTMTPSPTTKNVLVEKEETYSAEKFYPTEVVFNFTDTARTRHKQISNGICHVVYFPGPSGSPT